MIRLYVIIKVSLQTVSCMLTNIAYSNKTSRCLSELPSRSFCSPKKAGPAFFKEYLELFSDSNAIEAVLPRKMESYQDLQRIGVRMHKPKDIDLDSIQRGIIDPLYYLIDSGGKRWRPLYGLILAKDFGMNIHDHEKNRVLYHLLAIWELIHNATLIIDDIEDKSLKRRGKDCAYIKYGLDIAINAGWLLLTLPQASLNQVIDIKDPVLPELLREINRELVCVHFGQNWDINWHNGYYLPNEDDYMQMTSSKTGVIPRLIASLVCILNGADEALTENIKHMTDKLGIAFQIQDDVIALESDAYADARGIIGEDIHEGKRTLMVIHSRKNLPHKDGNRLIEILDMQTDDKSLIKEAIELIKSTKSIEYAKKVSENLITRYVFSLL